ncbi:hypothetical protein HK100_005274 [Physocladia obscura]|uniref:Isochorismatase-like domain-containing protein n=1 Tax=Physocladia obscura TaxID=109957 RepID=A0AAD5SU41_9FUNG|nr:hypothetical protein HK100_005274 [Physocladia obscura]
MSKSADAICSQTMQIKAWQSSLADSSFLSSPITPENCAFILIDIQYGTVPWIISQNKKTVVNNTRCLGRLAEEMNIPLLITVNMVSKMGSTIEELEHVTPIATRNAVRREGMLCCFDDQNFVLACQDLGRKKLVIAGLATDMAVFHTAVKAVALGFEVSVVADACASSSQLSDQVTFDRLRSLGVTITVTNMLLTELYNDFGTKTGKKAMEIQIEEVVKRMYS